MHSSPRGRRGFALVALLWALVLASALAIELQGAVRADQRAAANARAGARAGWAARGGLARLEARLRAALTAPGPAGALVGTDTLLVPAVAYRLERIEVRATARDARARLSLNRATEGELRAVFAGAEVEPGQAAELAVEVARWRAGRPAPPPLPGDTALPALWAEAGAFASVEELREVPGVSAADHARVAPYLTVAGDGRINVNTAPYPVLLALPGMDPDGARALLRRRAAAGPALSVFEVLDALPRSTRERVQEALDDFQARVAFGPRDAEIEVEARPAGSPVVARIRARAVLAGGARIYVVDVAER